MEGGMAIASALLRLSHGKGGAEGTPLDRDQS